MTAPAFDLGAEVSAANAQQLAAIRLGRAQMAQELVDTVFSGQYATAEESLLAAIELCEKECAK